MRACVRAPPVPRTQSGALAGDVQVRRNRDAYAFRGADAAPPLHSRPVDSACWITMSRSSTAVREAGGAGAMPGTRWALMRGAGADERVEKGAHTARQR